MARKPKQPAAPTDETGDPKDLSQLWSHERGFFMMPREVYEACRGEPVDLATYCELRHRARWKPGYAHGSQGTIWLETGQALFGREELAEAIGCSVGAVRGSLARHQLAMRIAIQFTKRGSIATFPDYEGSAAIFAANSPSHSPGNSPRPNSGSTNDPPVDSPLTNKGKQKTKTRDKKESEEGFPRLFPAMSRQELADADHVIRILHIYTSGTYSTALEKEHIGRRLREGHSAGERTVDRIPLGAAPDLRDSGRMR